MKSLFKFIFEITRDWLLYKHRGFAQPDHPDQENHPLINNANDAQAQRIIDEALPQNHDNKTARKP